MRQLKIAQSITARDSHSIEKYLQEVSKIELITAEEEVNLARLIKGGNQAALHRLTKANLRFVISVAKQYQFNGVPLSDMISEGNVGLIKAAERFDETKGFKFISYAVWWIRQSIIQSIYERGRLVRLPSNQTGLSKRVQKAFALLEQEYERAPTAEELGEAMQMNAKDVRTTLQLTERHLSLDAPNNEDGPDTLLDVLKSTFAYQPQGEAVYTHPLQQEINRSLQVLSLLQKDIVCSFFGLGVEAVSLDEIGRKHNLTAERVRQIKATAIARLRSSKNCGLLKSYL